jgi:dTMP kinase
VCAGAVYVVGFTLIQENVDDDLRGRVFATLYTLVRFSVLLALTLGPLFAGLLDTASRHLVGGSVHLGSVGIALTGVRLTLWLGACIILAAGASAFRTLRHAAVVRTDGVDG